MSLDLLGLALGASFAAGLNVYATVATLGLLDRLGWATLPPALEPLGHPVVIGVALALYAIEFVADKIPFIDNVWDVVHTFIRPPAAAVLAYAAVAGVPEPGRVLAALLAGGIALTSHGTKATARAVVNTSPEPISNSLVSVIEDGLAIGLAWMAAVHPVVTIALVVVLLVTAAWILSRMVRLFRRWLGPPARSPAEPPSTRPGQAAGEAEGRSPPA